MAPKKGKVKDLEKIRKQKREAERRRRAKIKEDPVKYAEAQRKEKERRIRRKEAKKILNIEDLTPRQQRAQRKEWCERQQKCRETKKLRHLNLERILRENTPSSESDTESLRPASVQREDIPRPIDPELGEILPSVQQSVASSPSVDSQVSRQRSQGQRLLRRNRENIQMVNKRQSVLIMRMKRQIHALQVQNARLNAGKDAQRQRKFKKRLSQPIYQKKISIRAFLEEDSNSKMCPGKKDTITKNKIKKQKRILCDSLDRLYKKYNSEVDIGLRVSYNTFCRLRPFWIVHAKFSERDTCLCALHENFNLLLERLRSLKIIHEEENNINLVIAAIVCDCNSYKCMRRKCEKCFDKVPRILEFENEQSSFKQWLVRSECRMIKGKEKVIKRTVKDDVVGYKKEMVENLIEMLPKITSHSFNIKTQYDALKSIKETLKSGEVLLHIDFSKNYSCKYFSEAQSVHFGASRQQISLHTGVLYFRSDTDTIETISFSTISDCLRHDACAVYAHIKKALSRLTANDITVLHIASDGPSSQYKNKSNFYLFTQHLLKYFDISEATWNFSESGHGKGAPDGVGAAIKRTADAHVAHGNDIPDFQTFYEILKAQSNVILYKVTEEEIVETDELLKSWTSVRSIPGTKNMHQLTWTKQEPTKINLRELTCTKCSAKDQCPHFTSSQHSIVRALQPENTTDSAPDDHHCSVHTDTEENHENEELDNPACDANPSTLVRVCDIRVGSWVLVKFLAKKQQFVAFVGQILSIKDDPEDPYLVKFLRKKSEGSGKKVFVWKEPDDMSSTNISDIVSILPEPTPTRRGELIFKFDFAMCVFPIM